jgi:hypothetical protein
MHSFIFLANVIIINLGKYFNFFFLAMLMIFFCFLMLHHYLASQDFYEQAFKTLLQNVSAIH